MAHFQLTAVAGGRDDEMEEVALLGSYDEEVAGEAEEAPGMRRGQVRVTGMTCSACTVAVEAAVSACRGVRRASVSLLQSRAHVVFDPALAKVFKCGPLFISSKGYGPASYLSVIYWKKFNKRGNQAYTEGQLAKADECYTHGINSVSPNEVTWKALMLCCSNRAATRMSLGRMRGPLGLSESH